MYLCFVVFLKVDEKAQTPQAGEEQPVITESGSTVLERQTFVTAGKIPGGRERLVKRMGDLGGRVRLPLAELKMCAKVLCKEKIKSESHIRQ